MLICYDLILAPNISREASVSPGKENTFFQAGLEVGYRLPERGFPFPIHSQTNGFLFPFELHGIRSVGDGFQFVFEPD